MQNTGKTQSKQTLGQKKANVQPGKKQPLQTRQLPAQTAPAPDEKYRRLFEMAQDGILLLDAGTGVISDANPAIEEMLGYSPAELIGKKLWETVPFKEVSANAAAFLKLHKKGYFRYENLLLEAKDGRRCNVDFVSNVYQAGSQKVIQCNLRDITERRQAENTLAESMLRYQDLFDNAGLGIFQTGADGRIMAVNPEFARLLGYQSPEELLSLVGDAADVFADPQRRAEIIRLKAENPDMFRFENLYRRKDGSTFFGSLTLRQVTGPDGQALFEGLVEDTTQRKQAEENVKLSEARYRSLVETQTDVISRSDLHGNLVFVNDSYCRTFGVRREQALGKHFKSTVFPEDLKVVYEMMEAIKRPPYRKYIEIRNETQEGVRWFDWDNSAVRDEQGAIIEFQGVGRDITERKQAEEALGKSEEKFRKAFVISPDSININRLQDGMYIAINNGFTQIMGYTEADCIGKTSAELNIWVDPEDRKRLIDGLLKNGEVINLEARFCAKNGDIKYGLMSASVLELNNIPHILSITRDITERKQAEEALRLRMEQLLALNQASQVVTTSLDLDRVLTEVMSLAGKAVGSDYTSVVLVDEAGTIGRSVENVPGALAIEKRARKSGFTKWVLRKCRAAVVDEIGEDGVVSPRVGAGAPRTANPHLVAQGIKSFAGLPLIVEGRTVGVLYLHSLRPGTFHEQLPLLTNFANQAAVAIEKARLYAEVQKELVERKRAEDALEKAERTYRLAITQAGIVPYQRYYQGEKFTILGEGFKSLTGYNPEEMTTQLFNSRLREIESFGEYKNLSREERSRLARKGEVKEWAEDYLFERKDGKKIWLAHHSLPLYGDNGDVIGSLGILTDITERKQVEEALRESESLLRESQVSAGLGSYALDIPSGLWKSSDMLDQVFGIDEGYQHTVDGWVALIHPDDRTMMVDYFNKEVLGQGRPFNKEYRIIRPDNHAERWVHGLGRLEFDARRQPVKMHGTIQDITERKQAQVALADERNLLRSLIDNAPDFIYVNRYRGPERTGKPGQRTSGRKVDAGRVAGQDRL